MSKVKVQSTIARLSSSGELDSSEQHGNCRRTDMMSEGGIFLLPDRLEPDLERVLAYWNGLKRGQ